MYSSQESKYPYKKLKIGLGVVFFSIVGGKNESK
jgi:hypothetical protein